MASVVVVGDRGSGKTTFLALLYSAQVATGSEPADDFRFHVAFDSMDEISGVFQQVMAGSFPDAAAKEGIRGITFRLGHRKAGLRVWSRLRSRGWPSESPVALQLIVLRNLEDQVSRFHTGSSLADTALRDVLASDAVAVLVDAGKFAAAIEDGQPGPMGKYDAEVESVLGAIQRSRGQGGRPVHPIFIITKFDSVDPEALRASKVDGAPPEIGKRGPRTAYAEALLDRHLPRTMAKVKARQPRGSVFARPSYFFSWLRTERGAPGSSARIRLRRTAGAGWRPDYSEGEYRALLEHLSRIAAAAAR